MTSMNLKLIAIINLIIINSKIYWNKMMIKIYHLKEIVNSIIFNKKKNLKNCQKLNKDQIYMIR